VRHARKRLVQSLLAASLVTVAATPPGSANDSPKLLADLNQAAALATQLGADRTGGTYYKDGRLVITVTDEAAARTVREAGGVPELVTRSAAELAAVHTELDELAGIPNTAWGEDVESNQVSVEVYGGVSAADQARIAEVAEAHPGAVSINRHGGKLEPAVLRGGYGITSEGWNCSAAFNAANSSNTVYTITAGHCAPGTGNVWYVNDSTQSYQRIGIQTAYRWGGNCDSAGRACDWATIKKDNAALDTYGTVGYWHNVNVQITNSRYAAQNEDADRVGRTSQDKVGHITKPNVTVTYDDGTTLYGMYESTHCSRQGDSGGPLLHGSTALGIVSGGNYVDKPCGDSDAQSDRYTYSTRIQDVLNERGLHVY